jgi:autotransporter-associated beta strand protein
MKPKITLCSSLTAVLVMQFATTSVYSATRFWDGTDANIGTNGDGAATNASGTWSTSIANWDQGAGLAHVVWNNAANDTAEFSGGTNAITLGSNVTVGRINQKGGGSGITIGEGSGPFTITLGSATTIFNVAASTTVGRIMNLNAVVTGSNNLSIQGPTTTAGGSVSLNRVNTFTGTLAVTDTTLQVGAAGQLNSGTYSRTISLTDANFNYSSSADQTLSGVISGNGNLTKNTSAASTLTLSGLNSLSGNITVSAGILVAGVAGSGGNSALGSVSNSRTITVNTGGTLRFDVGNVFNNNFASAATSLPALNIAGGTLTNGGMATNSALGNITLAGGTLTATTGSPLGTESGQGYGSWNLNGTITSTGTSAISSTAGGIPMTLSASAANGTITTFDVTSGTLTASASFADVTRAGNETVSGLTKSGAGIMILSGANTYSGGTIVNAGSLRLQNAAALGGTTAGTQVNGSGTGAVGNARLDLEGGITVTGESVTINGVGNFIGALSSTSGSNVWAGSVTIGSAGTRIGAFTGTSLEVSGVIDSGVATTGLIIRTTDLTGSVILSGANTYLGDTQILVGKLQLAGGDNRLPVGTNLVFGSAGANPDSEFDLNGRSQQVAGMSLSGNAVASKNSVNNSSATLSTLTVNTAAASPSSFNGVLKGNLALVKTGADLLTLGGTNSHTGDTTVTNGILRINGIHTDGGTYTVEVGGKLQGTGSITSAINVSGVLSPGASVQTFASGTLSQLNGSTFEAELDSSVPTSSGADLQIVSGDLSLTGTVALTLGDLAAMPSEFALGTTFSLINYSGLWNNGLFTFDGNEIADGGEFTAGLNKWQLDYNASEGGLNFDNEYLGTTDSFVNITAVVIPEPSSTLLGAIGALLLLRRRRS